MNTESQGSTAARALREALGEALLDCGEYRGDLTLTVAREAFNA